MTDVPAWVPVVAAVGAAAVGVCGALIGVFVKGRIDRKQRIESESKEQRFDLYKRLAEAIRYSDSVKGQAKAALTIDIGLFGSDAVVAAWTAYVDAILSGHIKGKDSPENLRHVGALLLAMRRDASRPDSKLTGVDMIAALGLKEGRSVEEAERNAREAGMG
jgi:hypothetical protein